MAPKDERGQVLILALGFLVFFGLVIGAIGTFVGANVLSTERLRQQRYEAYVADGATDAAIHVAVADPAIGAFGSGLCQPTGSLPQTLLTRTDTTPDGTVVTANVSCTATTTDDAFAFDRKITFTTSIGSTKMVVAVVQYHDSTTPVGQVPPIDVITWTYCGHDAGSCP